MTQKQARRPAGTEAAEGLQKDTGRRRTYSDEAAHASLSPVLTAELSRLFAAGFWLLPLGRGEDGRKPTLRFKRKDGTPIGRHPLAVVLNTMQSFETHNYTIRPAGMLVVDIDTDTPEAHAYVERWFGASTVQVKTGKGVHHYFRFNGEKPSDVRLPGIAIDFKAGVLDLVAGPFAERADGVHYWPLKGRLEAVSKLPEFVDRRPAAPAEEIRYTSSNKVAVGSRNKALYQRAAEYAGFVDNLDELVGDLFAFRNIHFDDPASVRDSEVRSVADWAWQLRLKNSLWAGRDSGVIINRTVGDRLLAKPYGTDAFALYYVLKANHGHVPGYRFAVVPDAMRKAGLINLCRNHIRQSLDMLIAEGLLIRHPPRRPGKPCEYQLTGQHPSSGSQPVRKDDDPKGGEVSSYIVTQIGTHESEGGIAA